MATIKGMQLALLPEVTPKNQGDPNWGLGLADTLIQGFCGFRRALH